MPTPPKSQPRCSRRFFVPLASCLVAAAAAFANAAAAYGTCPRVARAAAAAATGLPHAAISPEAPSGSNAPGCNLLLWSGHKPSPGKQSKAAEKAGRLARLTVFSENLHEPANDNNGFTSHVGLNRASMETLYMSFTVPTFGAEAAFAGTRKSIPSSFEVAGLWWIFSQSADVQIYLVQYHKSRLQLEHELTAIAARTVPAFGL